MRLVRGQQPQPQHPLSSANRAPGYELGGRRFDPCRGCHSRRASSDGKSDALLRRRSVAGSNPARGTTDSCGHSSARQSTTLPSSRPRVRTPLSAPDHASVAQSVERRPEEPGVAGSMPARSANKGKVRGERDCSEWSPALQAGSQKGSMPLFSTNTEAQPDVATGPVFKTVRASSAGKSVRFISGRPWVRAPPSRPRSTAGWPSLVEGNRPQPGMGPTPRVGSNPTPASRLCPSGGTADTLRSERSARESMKVQILLRAPPLRRQAHTA